MAVGGEIRSVLTLDATKFSAAIERAASNLNSLDKRFKSVNATTGTFEKNVTGLSDDVAGAAGKFKALEQTLASLTAKLEQVANTGFGAVSRQSRRASTDIDGITSSVRGAATSMESMTNWIKQYGGSLESLNPLVSGAAKGQRALADATEAAAKSTVDSMNKQTRAKLSALEKEKKANSDMIASRKAMIAELEVIESRMGVGKALAQKEASRFFGKNAAKGQPARDEAAIYGAQGAEARATIGHIQAIVKELQWKNGEVAKSIGLIHQENAALTANKAAQAGATAAKKDATAAAKEQAQASTKAGRELARQIRENARIQREADRASGDSARQAAAERKRAALDATNFEREQARQMGKMWQGMAQMWAGAKIEKGLGAGLTKASEFQQAEMRVKLLNLPTAEFEEFKKKAFDITQEEKYISTIDAMQARLDALTAIGTNHVKEIDNTMTAALQNAQVMMSSGYEHGNRSDLIKNLYGFAEARQVMNDPEKVIESFDIARRMGVASGGKINIGDMETVARSMGDMRQTLTKEGWLGVAALMEQYKVAGSSGGAGGAGAGVSSVGTQLKMMSLYASGKPVTNVAATQLLGADVMNDPGKLGEIRSDQTAYQRSLKTAGFKGVKEMAADPVTYFSGLRPQIMQYMKTDQQKSKFFEGDDTESDVAESAALKRYFAKMGMSNKTVDGMLTMMNKGFIERSTNVRQTAEKSDNLEQSVLAMKETWKNATSEMQAGADKLGAAFAPLLKPLSEIPKALGAIMTKASEFVSNNPITGAIDAALIATGGLMLVVNGAMSTFGMVGGVMSSIRTMMGAGTVATAAATSSWSGLRAVVLAASLTFPKLTGLVASAIGAAVRFAGVLLAPFAAVASGVGMATGLIGRLGLTIAGFIARWASPVGWLALAGQFGWVIGEWVSSVKVDGLEIGKHMQNIFLDIETGWRKMLFAVEERWIDFKKLVGGGDYLGETKDRAELAAKRAALSAYDKSMRYETKPEVKPAPGTPAHAKDAHGNPKADPNKPTHNPNVNGDIKDPFAKDARHVRVFADAFNKAFQGVQADADATILKIKALLGGDGTYEEQAKAGIMGKLLGGQFDEGGDPTNRAFIKKGFKFDADKGAYLDSKGRPATAEQAVDTTGKYLNGKLIGKGDKLYGDAKSVEDLVALAAVALKADDRLKALTFSKGKYESITQEANDATNDAVESLNRESKAMLTLRREFARLEATNPAADGDAAYRKDKAGSILALARQESTAFTTTAKDEARTNREALAYKPDGSVVSSEDKARAKYQTSLDGVTKNYVTSARTLQSALDDVRLHFPDNSDEVIKALAAQQAAADAYTAHVITLGQQQEEALLTPIEKMAREWKGVFSALEAAEVGWANSFVTSLENTLNTGKLDFASFATTVLKDIQRIFIQDQIAAPLAAGMKKITSTAMTSLFSQGKGKEGAAGGEPALFEGLKNALTSAAGGLKSFWNSLTGAEVATDGLANSTSNVVTESVKQLFGMGTKMTAEQAATASLVALTTAANAASISMGGSAGGGGFGSLISSVFGPSAGSSAGGSTIPTESFAMTAANGGVMTEFGEASLKRYAKGGVVNTPQISLFGEAGPEAYVPLPDGRSIPVTMQGGGGGNVVTIQINVQQGGDKSSEKGDEAGVWTKLAQRVKSVVREELVVNQRPGGLLYK